MRGRRRAGSVVAAFVVALLGVGALAGSASGTKATNKAYAVGDCFAEGDVSKDEVVISSNVACTSPHAVQVVAAVPLPKRFVKAGFKALDNTSSRIYQDLNDFGWHDACTMETFVKAMLPSHGATMFPVLTQHGVVSYLPGGDGDTGWALADKAAFNKGTADVLCTWTPNPTALAGSTGDIRALDSTAPLGKERVCDNLNPTTRQRITVACDVAHQEEKYGFVFMATDGLPTDTTTWTDAHWAKFDITCGAIAEVLMGAKHPELKFQADTTSSAPLLGSPYAAGTTYRRFSCKVVNPVSGRTLPAGTIVGLGTRTLAL